MNTSEAVVHVRRELSRRSRVGHAALLSVSLCGGTGLAALWWTEPWLPWRTQVAFLALIALSVAWSAHAAWVLARRAVLLATHRVRAAQLSVVSTSVFTLGSLTLWWSTGAAAAMSSAATGGVLLLMGLVLLVRAQRQRAMLENQLRALESDDAR